MVPISRPKTGKSHTTIFNLGKGQYTGRANNSIKRCQKVTQSDGLKLTKGNTRTIARMLTLRTRRSGTDGRDRTS